MPTLPLTSILTVPDSIARSKALISLYGTFGGYSILSGTPNLSGTQGLAFIANLTKITLPMKKGSSERRMLSVQTYGMIQEIVQGLTDYEGMEVHNVVTYGGGFLESCGFGGHDLNYVPKSMLFLFKLPSPDTSLYPELTLVSENTQIKTNPLEFSVQEKDNLQITQVIELHPKRLYLL